MVRIAAAPIALSPLEVAALRKLVGPLVSCRQSQAIGGYERHRSKISEEYLSFLTKDIGHQRERLGQLQARYKGTCDYRVAPFVPDCDCCRLHFSVRSRFNWLNHYVTLLFFRQLLPSIYIAKSILF